MNQNQQSLWQLLFTIISLALQSAAEYVAKREVATDPPAKGKR